MEMSIPEPIPVADKAESSLSFTQGLLLGQLSIVILIGAFIKFFIFGDPPPPTATPRHAPQPLTRKRSSVLRNPAPLTTTAILSKTYYNVDGHQPESLDWFNVLIAQTIAQFRADAQHDDAILTSLTKVLNGGKRPDFLDEIKVTELSLGEDFPIFSNCRVIPVDEDGMTLGGGKGGSGREGAWEVAGKDGCRFERFYHVGGGNETAAQLSETAGCGAAGCAGGLGRAV
ncbi:hypothetical protein DID88_008388 [Monilinia fructigena]|uniref:SMP-LTD domain-containing protein n=1 Tax=Monilinia fructigena TaxID=38457 RepID=A0A395JAA3_9HELO|nr:hypothetical protein DID88_008388 [Monilinia fructigena]